MKKKILFLLILFLPFMIDASEKCNIISGNGKDIGSEIACGTEHFYVIEDKEDSVRMLAKYNLEIGYEFNKVTVSEERYNQFKEICNTSYAAFCSKLLEEKEFENFDGKLYPYNNEDGTYQYMAYNLINVSEVKQSSKAIGAHGDESGNPEFPEYGVVGYISQSSFDEYSDKYVNNLYVDFVLDNIVFLNGDDFDENDYKYDNYKMFLEKNGIIVNAIDMISVKELNNIVYKLTGDNLPLEEWGEKDNWIKIDTEYHRRKTYIVGSIKEYLPNGYEWLYSTTYWTKTALSYSEFPDGYSDQDVFLWIR